MGGVQRCHFAACYVGYKNVLCVCCCWVGMVSCMLDLSGLLVAVVRFLHSACLRCAAEVVNVQAASVRDGKHQGGGRG